MRKKYSSECALGPRALEMVMRDVLGGMEELATMKGFESMSEVFEVISIDPPYDQENNATSSTPCMDEGNTQRADVISLDAFRNKKEAP